MDTPGWVCDAEYLHSPFCVSVMVPRLSALCVHVPVPWLSSGDTALTQSQGRCRGGFAMGSSPVSRMLLSPPTQGQQTHPASHQVQDSPCLRQWKKKSEKYVLRPQRHPTGLGEDLLVTPRTAGFAPSGWEPFPSFDQRIRNCSQG